MFTCLLTHWPTYPLVSSPNGRRIRLSPHPLADVSACLITKCFLPGRSWLPLYIKTMRSSRRIGEIFAPPISDFPRCGVASLVMYLDIKSGVLFFGPKLPPLFSNSTSYRIYHSWNCNLQSCTDLPPHKQPSSISRIVQLQLLSGEVWMATHTAMSTNTNLQHVSDGKPPNQKAVTLYFTCP